MDFFGKHRRPKLDEGKMDDVSKVETAGYIPADVQIEMFIQAGRRLDQARKEQFDFGPEEEVPEDFIDPTRKSGFDMADASLLSQEVRSNLERSAREEKERRSGKGSKVDDSGSVAGDGSEVGGGN